MAAGLEAVVDGGLTVELLSPPLATSTALVPSTSGTYLRYPCRYLPPSVHMKRMLPTPSTRPAWASQPCACAIVHVLAASAGLHHAPQPQR